MQTNATYIARYIQPMRARHKSAVGMNKNIRKKSSIIYHLTVARGPCPEKEMNDFIKEIMSNISQTRGPGRPESISDSMILPDHPVTSNIKPLPV